jgi:hypothetical protein
MNLRKLLSWAWLTCLFFIPELVLKSATKAFQVLYIIVFSSKFFMVENCDSYCLPNIVKFEYQAESSFGEFIIRELSAVAGAVTITCLMVCPWLTLEAKHIRLL